jgi:hypothetical protein
VRLLRPVSDSSARIACIVASANSAAAETRRQRDGKGKHYTFTSMTTREGEQSALSDAQRKAFADLLKPQGTMRQAAQRRREQAERELKPAIVREMAEQRGLIGAVNKAVKLRSEADKLDKVIEAAGFNLDMDGDLSIRYDAPAEIDHAMEKLLAKKLGNEPEVAERFDAAIIQIWAAQTLEEAKQVLDSVVPSARPAK